MSNKSLLEKFNWEISKTIYVGQDGDFGLYDRELSRARNLIVKTAKELGEISSDSRGHFNTVIGISGERGSGKSSFLYTLESLLSKQPLPDDGEQPLFHSLGVVDPASFEANMSALEILVTTLYEKYIACVQKGEHSISEENKALYLDFKSLTKILSSVRIDTSVFNNENPSVEILDHMRNIVGVREKIGELCDGVARLCGLVTGVGSQCDGAARPKSNLVLFIDDVDLLKGAQVAHLLDDVRKYLSGTLIVVMAYREDQLIETMIDEKLRSGKDLLAAGYVDREELQFQTADFLEKVLPSDRVIKLCAPSGIMGRRIIRALAPLSLNGDSSEVKDALKVRFPYIDPAELGTMTVADWIDEVVYRETLIRVRPVYDQEETEYIWPRNLRELFTFCKVVCMDMDSPWSCEGHSELVGFNPRRALENLEIYKSYYLKRLNRAIGPDSFRIIDQWLRAENRLKNYEAYFAMSNILFSNVPDGASFRGGLTAVEKSAIGDLLDINLMRPENVTVGDVSAIANVIIRLLNGNAEVVHFVHSIKVLYSIEILKCILECLDGAFEKWREDGIKSNYLEDFFTAYSNLINACILPPESGASRLSAVFQIPTAEITPEIYDAIQPFSCSEEFESYRAFKASRPRRSFSTPKSGESPFGGFNIPLFDCGSAVGSGRSRASRFLVNPTNYFCKQSYFDNAIRHILSLMAAGEGEGERCSAETLRSNGSYIFYSLFDIDIFWSLPFGSNKKADEVLPYFVKRIDALLTAVGTKRDFVPAGNSGSRFYNRLATRLSAPFVFGAVQPFGDKLSKSIQWAVGVGHSAFSIAYEGSRNVSFKKAGDLIPREKQSQRMWLEKVLDLLSDEGTEDEIDEIEGILRDLQQPYRKLSGEQREGIERIIRSHPGLVYELNETSLNG